MAGDDRTRRCERCEHDVHDVAAMDATAIRERGGRWCARIGVATSLAMAAACAHPRPVASPPFAFETDEPVEALADPGADHVLGIVVVVDPPPLLRWPRSFEPDDE